MFLWLNKTAHANYVLLAIGVGRIANPSYEI
jgi:hypothetical protein